MRSLMIVAHRQVDCLVLFERYEGEMDEQLLLLQPMLSEERPCRMTCGQADDLICCCPWPLMRDRTALLSAIPWT